MRGSESTLTLTSASHTFHMHRDKKSLLSTLKIQLQGNLECMVKQAVTWTHSMTYSLPSWFFSFGGHLLPIIYSFLVLTLNKAAFL